MFKALKRRITTKKKKRNIYVAFYLKFSFQMMLNDP